MVCADYYVQHVSVLCADFDFMCSKTSRQVRQAHCADQMSKSITCQRRGELEKDWYSLSCSLCLYLFFSASSLSPQRVCCRLPLLLHCKTNCQNSQRDREKEGEGEREGSCYVVERSTTTINPSDGETCSFSDSMWNNAKMKNKNIFTSSITCSVVYQK